MSFCTFQWVENEEKTFRESLPKKDPISDSSPNVTSLPSETIVTQTCAICHTSGMLSLPKLGNKDGWAPWSKKVSIHYIAAH